MRPVKPRPTLRDLAQLTGFHFTTIGLALRGDPRIRPETAREIHAAAQRLGYVKDAMLSALSTYRHDKHGHFAGVIGFLHTYDFLKEHRTNHRARQSYEAAANRAREMGFKLEPIRVDTPGLTGARLTAMLRARGIRGLILAPLLPAPGPFLDLDWKHFATVAMGYSITAPELHRASFNQAYSMRKLLAELRALGYQRIGLQLHPETNIRTKGNSLGAYLVDQYDLPARDRIPPFFEEKIVTSEFRAWIKKHRPDCLIVPIPAMLPRLLDMGYRIPEDFGLAIMSRDGEACKIAGIDEQSDLLGLSAVEFVVSLLQINQRGLPEYARYILVEGRWEWRPTVRAPAKA